MNIALTHIHAAASARPGSRNAFVRAVVLCCAVACAGLPGLASADRGQDGQRNVPPQSQPANHEQPRAERMVPAQQAPRQDHARQEQRQFDSRANEARAEENRRQVQQQDQGAGRRGGRLTPDERRELRRQINEAGIDLYPNAPRR